MNIIVYQITMDYYNTTDTYNITTDTYNITTKIIWKYYSHQRVYRPAVPTQHYMTLQSLPWLRVSWESHKVCWCIPQECCWYPTFETNHLGSRFFSAWAQGVYILLLFVVNIYNKYWNFLLLKMWFISTIRKTWNCLIVLNELKKK